MVFPLSASPVAEPVSANDLTQTDGELTPISPFTPDLWQLTSLTTQMICSIKDHKNSLI